MTNLLATVVLVLPGILAYNIFRMIGPAELKPKTNYEKTLIGLLYNIPGMLISWSVLAISIGKNLSYREFERIILTMPCFVIYLFLVFLTGLLIALWWNEKGYSWFNKLINKSREKSKRPVTSPESPWETFFGHEKSAFIGVYPIGEREKIVFGEVKKAFKPGDIDKGILLVGTEQFKIWFKWMGNPTKTYVDTVNKVVYEYYPASAWQEAKRRVKEYKASHRLSSEEGEGGSA